MVAVEPVIVRKRLPASRAAVWRRLSESAARQAWWPELSLQAASGGFVREQWQEGEFSRDASGAVDVCIPGHALGFKWRESGENADTAVLITLRSIAEETEISVVETGFGNFADGYLRVADARQAWLELLELLKKCYD